MWLGSVVVIVTSIVAVVGTLLGSLATHYFQRRNRADTERFERSERLRQERLGAYTTFGGALVNLRRAHMDRWYASNDHREGVDTVALRYETYRLYTTAQEALFRVQLVTEPGELVELGRAAIEATGDLRPSLSHKEFDGARETSRRSIYEFMDAARLYVGG
jgi:hypothetical protein